MLDQAQAELPNECCGLLAGRLTDGVGRVEMRYPLVNELASPREYNAAPKSLIAADKDMRARGIDLLAIYHSHPTTAPAPSKKDLERNFYGMLVMFLIIGLKDAQPDVRGWWLAESDFREAIWDIID